MQKKYTAKTSVAINVTLASGVSKHISFSSLTLGGSVFYTDDKEVQDAMERHHRFGKLFRLVQQDEPQKKNNTANKVTGLKKEKPKKTADTESPATTEEQKSNDEDSGQVNEENPVNDTNPEEDETSNEETENPDSDNSGVTEIRVSDPDEAKTILCEKFGISRTKLRSVKAINEFAAANGIELIGL